MPRFRRGPIATVISPGGSSGRDKRPAREVDHPVGCQQGIWDARVDRSLRDSLPELLQRDRGESCFFVEHQPGMTFAAALELFKVRSQNRQLRRSYRYTQIGLGLATAGLVAGGVLEAIGLFGWFGLG